MLRARWVVVNMGPQRQGHVIHAVGCYVEHGFLRLPIQDYIRQMLHTSDAILELINLTLVNFHLILIVLRVNSSPIIDTNSGRVNARLQRSRHDPFHPVARSHHS